MNVYQRLNAVRQDFHKLQLKKTGNNKFAGYNYFELGDFLVPALGLINQHGLCGIVSFKSDIATLTIRNIDQPEEYIEFTSPMGSAALKGCHEVQNIGAVETYQRRYLWVAALEIVEHDALDATTGQEEKKPAAAKSVTKDVWEKMGDEEQAYLRTLAADAAALIGEGRVVEANKLMANLDADEKVAIWSLFDSKQRAAMKAAGNQEQK